MPVTQRFSGESGAAAFALLSATIIIAHQVAGKATRDALFLSQFDVTELPKMVIAAAILTIGGVVAMSRLLANFGPARLMPIVFCLSAVLFVGEWLLFNVTPRLAAVALYFHIALFSAILISGFWSVVNERFDPHQARHAIARVAAAATLGGVLGGVITERVASLLDLRTMLLVLAAMHVLAVFTVHKVGRPLRPQHSAVEPTARPGFEVLRKTPYLQQMALLMVLAAIVAGLLDYAFKAEVAARFATDEKLAAFFATFYAAASLLTFFLQTFFGPGILQRFGLGRTICVLPVTVAIAGMICASFTHLWTVVALRLSESVLANSLFRSAFELLYSPLTPAQKRPTKTLIDVGADRLGDIFGGGLILLMLALIPNMPTSLIIGCAVATAAAALLIAVRLHRGYVEQLAESLRAGPVAAATSASDVHSAGMNESTIIINREDLVAQSEPETNTVEWPIASDDEAAVHEAREETLGETARLLHVIDTLQSNDTGLIQRFLKHGSLRSDLVPYVIPLLAHAELASDAMHALARIAPSITGQLVDALLATRHDETARRRLPRVLEMTGSQRALDGMSYALSSESFQVRYKCAQAMTRMLFRHEELSVSESRLFAAAQAEVEVDKETWEGQRLSEDVDAPRDDGINRSLEHIFTLLGMALDREALQLTMQAVVSDDPTLRGTALEYLQHVLPNPVRRGLWRHLGVSRPVKRSTRSRKEMANELLRSAKAMLTDRGRQKYSIFIEGAHTVIALRGEIDLQVSPNVREQLLELINRKRNVLVDLSGVEFIDSSGVAVLVEALRGAKSEGLEFALAGASEAVMQVLRLARLDRVFTIHQAGAPMEANR